MQLSFRWYGPNDPVSLSHIRQSNAEYIVTSLHQIPYGMKWNDENIKKRINFIKKHNSKNNINLKWNVVESIPVHNNIKLREKNYKKLVDNYKDTIRNIAKNKIYTVCYNFMPIVDWTRTQLDYVLPTDGLALRFSYLHLIIFEKFILRLKDVDQRYSNKEIKKSEILYKKMTSKQISNLKLAIMGDFSIRKKYSVKNFKEMISLYRNYKKNDLQDNLKNFLKEIVPVAEDNNVKMAIHPDDPPIPLFGIPKVVSTLKDYKHIFNSYNSPNNGMTFCSGSLPQILIMTSIKFIV